MRMRVLTSSIVIASLLGAGDAGAQDLSRLLGNVVGQMIQGSQQQQPPPQVQQSRYLGAPPPQGASKSVGTGRAPSGAAASCVGGAAAAVAVDVLVTALGGSGRKRNQPNVLRDVVVGCAAALAFSALKPKEQVALDDHASDLLSRQGPVSDVWTSPETHQQVTLQTSAPSWQQQQVDFDTDTNVAPPPSGVVIDSKTYVVAATRLNFRSSPSSTDASNIIGFFDRGENIEVMGRTADGQWALLGDEGVLVGYAAVRAAGKDLIVTPEAMRQQNAAPRPRAHAKLVQTATSADGVIRTADPKTFKKVTVVASTQCKALSAQNGEASFSKTGCQSSTGKWAMI